MRMKRCAVAGRFLTALAAATAMAAGQGTAAAAVDVTRNFAAAPLSIPSQSPAQTLRLAPGPSVARDIPAGEWHVQVSSAWSNIWAQERQYLMDYEVADSVLSISYGISRRWALEAAVQNRSYFGGAMDGFIEAFHNLVGVDQDGRDKVPNDQNQVVLRDTDGTVVFGLDDASVLNNTQLRLSLSHLLTPGTRLLPALSISATLGWLLESPFSDDGERPDVSFGMGLSKRLPARIYLHHSVNYTIFGETHLGVCSMRRAGFTVFTGLAWRYGPRCDMVLQHLFSEGLAQQVWDLRDASHEVHLGGVWRLDGGRSFSLAVIENIIAYHNSPDFGVHLSFGWSY